MGSAALAGKTSELRMGDVKPPGTPVSYDLIGEVTAIGDLDFNRATYDATSYGASITRDVIAGLADPIQIEMTLNYVQAQYNILWGLANDSAPDGPLEYWRIMWPDGYWHEFEAFVTRVSSRTPLDEKIDYDITLSVTQDITYGTIP